MDALLLETGNWLLLEDGGRLLFEQSMEEPTLPEADMLRFYIRQAANGFFNIKNGPTYTLQTSDSGLRIGFTGSSASTVTIPSGLGEWFCCEVWQLGSGQVSIVPADGVSLNSYNDHRKLLGQNVSAFVVSKGADDFLMDGSITA